MNTIQLEYTGGRLDYFIDSIPLWEWVQYVTGEPLAGTRSATPFGPHLRKKDQRRFFQMLIGKRPGDYEGSVPLYVCDYCADYCCGATSVIVSRTDDTIRWTNFALGEPAKPLASMPTLVFDKTQYRNAFNAVSI